MIKKFLRTYIKKNLRYGSYLYRIYLFYNLYIKEKFYLKRKTYSQNREDLFINKFFKKQKKGYYLDIGAFHPLKFSNTQLLYNRGWNGINIDMNPVSIDCFNIVRTRDKNIKAAISNKRINVRVLIDDYFNSTNSLILEHFKKYNPKFSKKKFFYTTTNRVSDFISQNIDFLNIDLEGLDFEVIKDINLKKLKPKLICAEMLNEIDKKKYSSFLKIYNYKLIKQISSNLFFSKT